MLDALRMSAARTMVWMRGVRGSEEGGPVDAVGEGGGRGEGGEDFVLGAGASFGEVKGGGYSGRGC